MLNVTHKYVRKAMLAIVAGAAGCYLSACGNVTDSMPPERFLALSISGLAGVDQYAFAGESGILLPAGVTVGAVSYRGEVTEHAKLSVQMTGSGDELGGKGGVGVRSLKGNWKLLSKPGADSWLPDGGAASGSMKAKSAALANDAAPAQWTESAWEGLNPLERLERIKESAKLVTYKEGAADGQRTVVIELEPSEAKREWRSRIESEWRAIAEAKLSTASSGAGNSRTAVYKQAGQQLAEMLDTLRAETTIEVTSDRRSMLPLRVREKSTLHFQANGIDHQEFHSGVVTFEGY